VHNQFLSLHIYGREGADMDNGVLNNTLGDVMISPDVIALYAGFIRKVKSRLFVYFISLLLFIKDLNLFSKLLKLLLILLSFFVFFIINPF